MGRKEAPQPLALADSHSHAHIRSGPSTGSNGSATLSAPTSSTPSSSALGIRGAQSPRGIAGGGETNLQVNSPAPSKSPRSPRSPFSKFNTSNKKPETRLVHTSHGTSPSQLQSKFSSSQGADSPRFDYKAGPVADSYDQEYYHYPQSAHANPSDSRPNQPNPRDRTPSASPVPPTGGVDAGRRTPTLLRDGAGNFQIAGPQPLVSRKTAPAREEEKHTRSASRFFNFKSSKNPQHRRGQTKDSFRNRDPSPNPRINDTNSSSEGMSRGADSQLSSDRGPPKTARQADQPTGPNSIQRPMASQRSHSDLSLTGDNESSSSSKKDKQKPFALLTRTKSMKERQGPSPREAASEIRIQEPERTYASQRHQQPLRTAPMDKEALHDRSYRHRMDSPERNHSADRAAHRDRPNKDLRPDRDNQNRSHPSSFKESAGSSFLGNLKSSGSRAADIFSNRFFGNKSSRSASTTEREPVVDDEHYQLKVINLPLVEQARKTRISKKLEDARDKTEFWMPAFPWRAIDYLNYKGSDVEGLYRVPGSGPQIKKWQRKFDEEYDVDLFAQEDLYDINIIGSMLKAWLRELPDELFPKEAQERISRECAGAETVPQLLIDELSNLQPYNYYLLFAITCHLSLLLAHSEKNRMDFRNLCICFQPCLKIDAFCFRFLVCDWRECWKGCKNEAKFIEEEYALMHQPPPAALTCGNGQTSGTSQSNPGHVGPDDEDASIARGDQAYHDEEHYDSSPGSTHVALQVQGPDDQHNGKLRKKSTGGNGSNPAGLTVVSHDPHARSNELRPLSPIKPLSPLNF